jgi:hypothetical protein
LQIARARVEEMAAPITALACDGAFYDLAALEERWGHGAWGYASDFHARIFGLRCAGIAEVDARLRSGDRPTEARLLPQEMLPLPPCDDERAAYFQLAPYAHPSAEPIFELRSARSLVGDGQPVSVPTGEPRVAGESTFAVELGVAAIVAEELEAADAREARRAIFGYSLLIDWTGSDRWTTPRHGRLPQSQLGPWIATGAERLRGLEAVARVGGRELALGSVTGWRFSPAEALSFLSQAVPLRPGDVVGLGAIARLERVAFGERVTLAVRGLGALTGWAADGRRA